MNGAPDTWELMGAILRSGSFWSQTVPLFAAAFGIFAAGAWFVWSRFKARDPQRLRDLARNESGSAEAMDFVLTFPIVLAVAFLFIQFLMGAHASLVVHYSAYSAARAARTAFFDITLNDIKLLQGQSLALDNPIWQPAFNKQTTRAQKLADTAARLALISAVPAAVKMTANPCCAGAVILNAVGNGDANRNAIRKKAAYAQTPKNVKVTVEVVPRYQQLALIAGIAGGARIDGMPVHARVEFKYPLVIPGVARVFGKAGVYTMSAEVTLF